MIQKKEITKSRVKNLQNKSKDWRVKMIMKMKVKEVQQAEMLSSFLKGIPPQLLILNMSNVLPQKC